MGLGRDAVEYIYKSLVTKDGVVKYRGIDVPNVLMHGKKMKPLGRYLTRKLRKRFGLDEGTPPEVLKAWQEELSVVLDDAYSVSRATKTPVNDVMAADRHQQDLNANSRYKLFNSRGKL